MPVEVNCECWEISFYAFHMWNFEGKGITSRPEGTGQQAYEEWWRAKEGYLDLPTAESPMRITFIPARLNFFFSIFSYDI